MALIIMRRQEESLMIGECQIIVTKIQGNQVHLAINAPKEIKVVRSELLGKIKSYEILEDEAGTQSIKCLVCEMESWNANDIKQLFCGSCDKFHSKRDDK